MGADKVPPRRHRRPGSDRGRDRADDRNLEGKHRQVRSVVRRASHEAVRPRPRGHRRGPRRLLPEEEALKTEADPTKLRELARSLRETTPVNLPDLVEQLESAAEEIEEARKKRKR